MRCLAFVAEPCCPTKPEPVSTAFAKAEAAQTDVVVTVVAPRTVVMQLILNVILRARIARYVWLGIELWCF